MSKLNNTYVSAKEVILLIIIGDVYKLIFHYLFPVINKDAEEMSSLCIKLSWCAYISAQVQHYQHNKTAYTINWSGDKTPNLKMPN